MSPFQHGSLRHPLAGRTRVTVSTPIDRVIPPERQDCGRESEPAPAGGGDGGVIVSACSFRSSIRKEGGGILPQRHGGCSLLLDESSSLVVLLLVHPEAERQLRPSESRP